MNQLLKEKTLYMSGRGVEMFKAGDMWGVKTYKFITGQTISTFRTNSKETALAYFDAQEDPCESK